MANGDPGRWPGDPAVEENLPSVACEPLVACSEALRDDGERECEKREAEKRKKMAREEKQCQRREDETAAAK